MGAIDNLLSGTPDKREEEAAPSSTGSAIDQLLAGPIAQEPEDDIEMPEPPAPAQTPIAEQAEKVTAPEAYNEDLRFKLAGDLGIDVDDVPAPHEAIKDIGTIRQYGQGVVNAYKVADLGMEKGRIGHRMKMGTASDVDLARLEEINKNVQGMQDEMQAAPFAAKSFGQLAPFLVNSAVKGGKGALIGGMIGGIGAAVLGQLGPQAALPEEIATVPAATAIGAKIGGSFASVSDIADIEGGSAYLDMIDMGMDQKKAAIASDIIGTGSGLLELAQFKMLKRLLPGSDKIASSAISRAVKKVMTENAAGRGASKIAGAAIPEAGVETVQEFWNNVVTTAATEIRGDLDKTDLSPQSKSEYIDRLTEGLVETFATTVTGFGITALPGAAVDVMVGGNKKAKTDGNGTTIVTENKTSPDVAPTNIKQRPSVQDLLSVDAPDGVSLSKDLNVSQGQADEQLSTNDTMTAILKEMATDKGLQQVQLKIDTGEKRIDAMKGFLDDAVLSGDPEGALQVAQTIKQEADNLANNYIQMVELSAETADANNSLVNPDNINKIQAHVGQIMDDAKSNVIQQTNAVQSLQKQQAQVYIDTLNTDQGLEQELIDASVESQRTSGKVLKTNGKVVTEMKMMKAQGVDKYFESTPMQKLIALKVEVGNQALTDRRNNESADVMARNNAMNNWTDRMIKAKDDSNVAELERENLELELQRSIEAETRKEQKLTAEPTARPSAQRAPVTTKTVTGGVTGPAAAKKVSDVEQARKSKAADQEQKRMAAKAKLAEGKRLTVQEQRARLRKPAAQPSRTVELGEAKADKAKRDAAVARQIADNEDLLPDLADDQKSKAKKVFRSAAISFGGKVYEGNSHIDVVMKNPVLAKAIETMDPRDIMKQMKQGFVHKSGTFMNRVQATKMIGKEGDVLYSEDFLAELAAKKAGPKNKRVLVLQAIAKPTKENKLAAKLLDKFNVDTRVVTVADVKKFFTPAEVAQFKAARAVYSTKEKAIFLNADQLGAGKIDAANIGTTYLHEALHATIDGTFRKVNKDAYRKGMRAIQEWYNYAGIWLSPKTLKGEHVRVKAFAQAMKFASDSVDAAEASLHKGLGSVAELDKALRRFEEALTYPFTSPEVAEYLNRIDAPKDNQSGKIRTLWDALVDSLLRGFGVATRSGSSLAELTRIANTIFELPTPAAISEKDVRMAKELDDSFDFGANVSKSMVESWAQELDTAAANALKVVVVKDSTEAAQELGYTPAEGVSGFWLGDKNDRNNGKVVIISDNINSREHFVSKWMHEQVAHQGLRDVFGANERLFNRFIDQAYTMFSIKEVELLDQVIKTYDLGKDKGFGLQLTKGEKRIAAEEMIALKAEQLKPETKKGVIAAFKRFLKKWLPKRFVDVKAERKKLQISDKDIMNLLAASKESIMTGKNPFGDLISKSLAARAPRVEYQAYDTLPKFMFTDREYKDMALNTLKKAPNLKKWYSQHTATLKENFGPDADLFSILLAVTSPQAPVENNVQFAAETYAYMMGLTNKPGAMYPGVLQKRIDSNWTSVDRMLKDLESKNFKVTEFARALLGDVDATVGDVWMFRLFFGDPAVFNKEAETYSTPQITALRQKLHDLAAQLSDETGTTWTPREVQAATWVYINATQTGKDITQVADYQSGFRKPVIKWGGKTVLEWLNGLIPDMNKGPLSQQLGLKGIPLAPLSPLNKKLIEQKAKALKGKYPVSTKGDIKIMKPDTSDTSIIKMVRAIVDGGRTLSARNQELADFYQKIFGFESIDGSLNMALGDKAIALYTHPKFNKIKPGLVYKNLTGFSGSYTREVRFARDMKQPLENIETIEFTEADRKFLATANDGQSVTGKIHEWRDQSELNVNRFSNQLEQELLEKFGGRKPRLTKIAGSGRKLNTSDTELLQRAMNLWIDSGTGANRAKAEAFANKIARKHEQGKATAGELEKLDTVLRMLSLNEEEISWASNNISHYYQEFFNFAQENGLIDSHVDNYVKRIWKMPKAWEDANIIWNGSSTTGFKVTPSSGKQRTLESIIDGWELGLELRTEGAVQNLQSYATEIGYVNANRRFMEYMDSLISEEGHGVVIELEAGQKPPAGFVRLDDRGFAMPGMEAFARADIAAIVNKLGDRASHKFWNLPVIKTVRKINAVLKSTLLSVSMFHHLAGIRSWSYGVQGTGVQRVRPIKAYREGLKKIDQQTGFDSPNYEHLGPIVDLLVREGLTLGRTQDWDGDAMMDSAMEEWLRKSRVKGSRMLLEGWQGGRRWKRQWTNGLFGRLFAGLKAEAGATELAVKIRKAEKKHGRGLTDAEVKAEAIKVSRLINADFGGLHLKRMGRNPDLQKVLQLFLLAPDWTESNWRTVTGMVPGLNRGIAKVVGDNPPPPGMDSVYRKFWGGIAIRGILTVLIAQWSVLALFGDDDDRDEYYKQTQQALISREEFAKGRWATVDLTPVFKRIGAEVPEGKRIAFNVLGHFKDILKAVTPVTLAKHKISPVVRTVESFATRTDWKGDRFKTVGELWEGLSDLDPALTVEKGKGPRDPDGYFGAMSQLLAAGAYNLRSSLPIPLSEMLTGAGSESSMLASIGRAGGVDVRDVRFRDPNEQMYWETSQEIIELERKLDEAKRIKDRKLIVEARRDMKAYGDYNRIKSRLGFTKARLRPINSKIKTLELKRDQGKLKDREVRKLSELNKRKAEIYEKFADVLKR